MSRMAPMKCRICGSETASVREGQRGMALLTRKAHIQCGGHAQYRALTPREYMLLQGEAVTLGRTVETP